MGVTTGTQLGPYTILTQIGAGGMGEVYKARDTRLDRIVAIKVSKTEFSERFEREAKAIAALNHPHICQIYDVGPNYLVMEHIEGDPLKGPLTLEKALEYAGQIASALDAAHTGKITHRDLKPANILVTKSAGVKLLDFGLAKIEKPAAVDQESMTMGLTMKGQILGTLLYMSPEQVNGQEADSRSDIFSFGLVLYEMLTGKRAFDGSTPASVIAAILERPAPSVADVAPPALDRVLKRCLEKDPEQRWQSARDLKAGLELVIQPPPEATVVAQPFARHGWLWWGVAGVMALLFIASIVRWAPWRAAPSAELRPLMRLDLDLGDLSGGPNAVLSPDATRVVYVSEKGLLVSRRLDQSAAGELPGTLGASLPFFSPNGQWVAFYADGKLKKVSVLGGTPIALCEANAAYGGSWGEDGNIIIGLGSVGALMRVPESGGMPSRVTPLLSGEISQRWPQILQGGKAVLFTTNSSLVGWDSANIDVLSLSDGRRKTLIHGGTFARYLPSGHLVYVNRGTLFAVQFNVERLEVQGVPSPVLDGITYSTGNGWAKFDFSSASWAPGMLLFGSHGETTADGSESVTVQWVDASGRMQPLLARPGAYIHPDLSPNGQRLVLEMTEGATTDVGIYDWERDTLTPLTFGGGEAPLWSPDGRYIVFRKFGEGLFYTRMDGSGKPQLLVPARDIIAPWSFSSGGKYLAFQEQDAQTGWDIYTVRVENGGSGLQAGKPEVFLKSMFNELDPSLSPDGRWLAYASNESGTYEVYVRPFPDSGGKWRVSNSGGRTPVWSRQGGELFFNTPSGVMAAKYTATSDSFAPEKPRVWYGKPLAGFGGLNSFVVSPDGKRILVMIPAESTERRQAANHVVLLINFFDELRRRVPVAK